METYNKTLGKVPVENIRILNIPLISAEIIAGFQSLEDLTGTVSDALDQIGINSVIGSFRLPSVNPGKRIIGPALTVRNVEHRRQSYSAVLNGQNGQGETEAHNLMVQGNVLVMEGVQGVSNMGGMSATLCRRAGCIGAVIEGTVRDPQQYREMNWPVWCSGFTPQSGKWRLQTIEINGTVSVGGIRIDAGDLICADDAGIAVIPNSMCQEVLHISINIDRGDKLRKRDIDNGVPLTDIVKKIYK